MSRVAYVNGLYTRMAEAAVPIEDRGYQFSDGIYEVIEIKNGALIDEAPHLDRLARSLTELRIAAPMGPGPLGLVLREVIKRNRVYDGIVYLQVTRGVARRDHPFPDPPVKPCLVVTARQIDPRRGGSKAETGIKVLTMPDLRWKRPDIKSISLLANILAKQDAKEQGCAEAWLIDDEGKVTEGSSSNAWIIDKDGTFITHPVDNAILRGITRTTLMGVIHSLGRRVEERRFSVAEAYAAQEAFATSASTIVTSVVAIDDRPVGDGRPGPIALDLRRRFHAAALQTR